jgi:hypothetical protein
MREYRYRVDREGRIFHDGTEIVDPQVLRFFLRAMKRTPEGRYLVLCQGEHNWFEPDDTAFVVQRLRLDAGAGGLRAVELRFAGDYRESLDPATLAVEEEQLTCRIRKGGLTARFGRVAMQQLAPFLMEEDGRVVLSLDGVSHPVPRREPAPV